MNRIVAVSFILAALAANVQSMIGDEMPDAMLKRYGIVKVLENFLLKKFYHVNLKFLTP